MAMKDTVGSPAPKADLPPFLNWGQERTGAALALQKELLASYEQVNRAWLARVQSEIALWSDLATKLTATKTLPEALEAYAKCVSERMKMAADDGRLLADEAQQIMQKITKALGNGRLNRGPAPLR
jgi:Phasin protein